MNSQTKLARDKRTQTMRKLANRTLRDIEDLEKHGTAIGFEGELREMRDRIDFLLEEAQMFKSVSFH